MLTINRFFAALLIAAFLIVAFGTVTAYAKGGPEEPEVEFTKGSVVYAESYAPPIIPIVEEAPTAQQPLTPPGTGTVVDNVTNENGIEFFTITSAAGNIFFLIIDRHRETENVYFLNAVTERDLLALAEESGDTWPDTSTPPPIIPGTPPTPEPIVEAEPEPLSEPEEDSGGGMGMIVPLIILILGGGAAGYYFKVYRPKQQGADIGDDFDYEDDYSDEADPYSDTEDDTPPWEIDEADSDRDGEE